MPAAHDADRVLGKALGVLETELDRLVACQDMTGKLTPNEINRVIRIAEVSREVEKDRTSMWTRIAGRLEDREMMETIERLAAEERAGTPP